MTGRVTRDQIIAVTAVKKFKELVEEYRPPSKATHLPDS